MKIANKISFSMVVVALIITVGAVIIGNWITRRAIKDAVYAHLIETAESKMLHVSALLDFSQNAVFYLSKGQEVRDFFLQSGKGDLAEKEMSILASEMSFLKDQNKYFQRLYLLNRKGKVLASVGDNRESQDKDIFVCPYQKSRVCLSDIMKQGNEMFFFTSVPVLGGVKNSILGHISAKIDASFLTDITLNRAGFSENQKVYLVNSQGYIITPSRFLKGAFLKKKISPEILTALMKETPFAPRGLETSTPSAYRDYRGVKVLGVHAHIPGSNWVLFVERDFSEAFASLKILDIYYIFILICCPLIAGLAGFYLNKNFLSPLESLQRGAKIIGSGNMDYRISIKKKDEFGTLGQAFNEMASNLREKSVSTEYLDNLIQTLSDPLIILNEKGLIKTVNQATLDMLGYTEEKIREKGLVGILPEIQNFMTHGSYFINAVKNNEFRNYETILKRKDQQEIPILLSASLVSDKNTKMKNIVLTSKDITVLKKAEEEISQKTRELEQINFDLIQNERALNSAKNYAEFLINVSPNAVFTVDTDCIVRSWNLKAQELTGYPEEEVIGKKCSLFSEEPCNEHCGLFDENVIKPIVHAECTIRRKDGELRLISKNVNCLKDDKGKVIGGIETFEDVTEKKRAQEMLEQKSQQVKEANLSLIRNERALKNMMRDMKQAHNELQNAQSKLIQSEKMASLGQLSAGVAHEINNPLGFIANNIEILEQYIQGYSDLLRAMDHLKQSVKDQDLQEAGGIVADIEKLEKDINLEFISQDIEDLIRQTKNGAERIKKIVLDLKTFSRSSEGKMEPENVVTILEGVLSIVWNEIKYKAELKKDYKNVPKVKCDSQKLGQVFINLLINASQAIKDNGEIHIKIFEKNRHVVIEISDNGCGIPPEQIGRIFDPFFTTKEVGKGTGLGLSIGYDIIKQHHGTMEVSSVEGKGTTFTIRLPVADDA